MANADNLKGKGFESRTTSELREISSLGGKKSGEARRKKANFRKTLNALLTAEIYNEDISPFLESLGLDSTLEAAVNAVMIREALNGNVKAYEAIAKYSGQDAKTEKDREEQKVKMNAVKEKMERERMADEKEDRGVEIKISMRGEWME